jgi:internalin A
MALLQTPSGIMLALGRMQDEKENEGLQEALRRIEEARKTRAINLFLGHLGLTHLPDSVADLTNLSYLDIRGNQISVVPEFIRMLSHLKELNVGNNWLTTIPEWILCLEGLEALWAWGNQITTIPDSIAQLSRLGTLSLHHNRIYDFSPVVRLLELESLYLGNNLITTIPVLITQLRQLKLLDLRNNRLRSVPEQLAYLFELNGLFLHGNLDLDVPKEILGPTVEEFERGGTRPKPPREILAYFAQIGDSRPLNEAKLILLGQGAVGKTSLVKRLITGKFNKREKNTEGIKISDWPLPLNRNDTVTIHVWDFGGQEMMHATHQFFLTQRSLYLLVLNRRQGGVDREADYWFRLIRAFGGKDAPVIVVLNKQKREPFDVNREGWMGKYQGNIKGFVATDCEDAKSITQLKHKIVEEIRVMESLKSAFRAAGSPSRTRSRRWRPNISASTTIASFARKTARATRPARLRWRAFFTIWASLLTIAKTHAFTSTTCSSRSG